MLGTRLAYDSKAGVTVLFGGWNLTKGGGFHETWTFDLRKLEWKKMAPKTAPRGRNFAQMTFDEKAGKVVLFGGDTGVENAMFDSMTWLYDTAADEWTGLDIPGPEQAFYSSLNYVPDLGGSILFGGAVGPKERVSKETWLFDASAGTWKKLAPAHVPAARAWHTTAYDGNAKRLWLYGGGVNRNSATDELWYFDVKKLDWVQVKRPKK